MSARNEFFPRVHESLAFKVGAAIVLTEILVLAIIGMGFTQFLNREIDRQAAERVQIPGRLLMEGGLSYNSIEDRRIMTELAGEDLIDGMIVGLNGNIFHSYDPNHLGNNISTIPGVDPKWFNANTKKRLLVKTGGGVMTHLMSITPLFTFKNSSPTMFAYIKVNTSKLTSQKGRVLRFILFGSIFCVLATSIIIYYAFKALIFKRVNNSIEFVELFGEGDLSRRVADPGKDELGILENGMNSMASAFETKTNERDNAEEALRDNEERYRTLYNTTPVLMHSIDSTGTLVNVNDYWLQTLGYERDEAVGEKSTKFLADESKRYAKETVLPQFFKDGFCKNVPYQMVKKDGAVIDVLLSATSERDEEGNVVSSLAQMIDITEIKKAEETIKASLEEKEVLLKEIHHRVKNNLQVVSSMLSLQADAESDERIIEALHQSELRIRALARAHENLHQSDDMFNINVHDYLSEIVSDITLTNAGRMNAITISEDFESIYFDIDWAIPCGQILSELLSNVLKHAFPNDAPGNINVHLRRANTSVIELSVRDDGVGFPEDFDFNNCTSLGLELVGVLAKKLKGEVKIDQANGTNVQVFFEG